MPTAQNYDDLAFRRIPNLENMADKLGLAANIIFVSINIHFILKYYS